MSVSLYRWFGGLGAALTLALLGVGWLAGLPMLAAWLLAVNLVTLGAYGYDKRAAGTGRRRIPERVLQGLALAGGSPAALLAMRRFRHKTVKRRFRAVYWAIVSLQAGLLLFWLLA